MTEKQSTWKLINYNFRSTQEFVFLSTQITQDLQSIDFHLTNNHVKVTATASYVETSQDLFQGSY